MTASVNVLIPMAGQGKRFRQAGYDSYKPFVEIFGKPMIQWVLDAFPATVTKRILADRSLLTMEQVSYLESQPGVVVHFIQSHSLGPAYSIYAARDELPLDEAFFIAYCDIFWTWDYSQVEPLLTEDAVVFTRREFHPHLVGNSYSAFCRAVAGDPGRLEEIREKGSFTDDWMSEPLSIGAFYVRDGHAMMSAVANMIETDRRVSNEFFPSLIFNDLIARGQTVLLHDVDFFVHWGVPAQLEDLRMWVRTNTRLANLPPASDTVNVCCMGGAGARMQNHSEAPKALIPVNGGLPMFRFVADHFGSRHDCFLVNHSMAQLLGASGVSEEQIVDIGPPTNSQLATLRAAGRFLREQTGFLLTSCDAFGVWNRAEFDAFIERERPDAVIFTFEPTLLQTALGGHHTYVESSGGQVTSVHIKHRPSDTAKGLAGFFWFGDGGVFGDLDKIPEDPGHELCADHVLKYMVDQGRKVGAFQLESYVHLGSPAELDEFSFWNRFQSVFAA